MKKQTKTAVGKRATGKRMTFIDVELPKGLRARVDKIAALTKSTPERVVYDALSEFMEKLNSQADTFKLAPSLACQLHEAAGLMTATPEWFIQEALGSLIRSTHEDGGVRSDMQDSYLADVKRKKKCAVVALERSAAQ